MLYFYDEFRWMTARLRSRYPCTFVILVRLYVVLCLYQFFMIFIASTRQIFLISASCFCYICTSYHFCIYTLSAFFFFTQKVHGRSSSVHQRYRPYTKGCNEKVCPTRCAGRPAEAAGRESAFGRGLDDLNMSVTPQ